MSQSQFPFVAVEDSPGTDKRIVVAAGAAAVIILGAGGFFLLHGSGSDDAASNVPPPKHIVKAATAAPTASPTASPSATAIAAGAKKVTVKSRNPFIRPLAAVPKTAAVAPAPGASPAPGGAPVVVPSLVPSPAPVAPAPASPAPADGTTPAAKQNVTGQVAVEHSVTTGSPSCADVGSIYTIKVIGSDNTLQSEAPVNSTGDVSGTVTANGSTTWTCRYPFTATVDGTASPYTFALIGTNDKLIDATSVTLASLATTPVVLTDKEG